MEEKFNVSGSKATLSLCPGVMSQTSRGRVLAGDVMMLTHFPLFTLQ